MEDIKDKIEGALKGSSPMFRIDIGELSAAEYKLLRAQVSQVLVSKSLGVSSAFLSGGAALTEESFMLVRVKRAVHEAFSRYIKLTTSQ